MIRIAEERFWKMPLCYCSELDFRKVGDSVLHYLEDGPVRFNELQRLMPKMTHATSGPSS